MTYHIHSSDASIGVINASLFESERAAHRVMAVTDDPVFGGRPRPTRQYGEESGHKDKGCDLSWFSTA